MLEQQMIGRVRINYLPSCISPDEVEALDGEFGCLESPDRFASVTVLLEEPRDVHGSHQFIKQMAVAMTVPAGSQGEMTG